MHYILVIVIVLSLGEPAVTVKQFTFSDRWECLNAGIIKYNSLRKEYRDSADIVWHCSPRGKNRD